MMCGDAIPRLRWSHSAQYRGAPTTRSASTHAAAATRTARPSRLRYRAATAFHVGIRSSSPYVASG